MAIRPIMLISAIKGVLPYAPTLCPMPLAVAFQKTRNTPDRFDQIIHIGQEHHADVVWMYPVEAAALYHQDLLGFEQFQNKFLVVLDRIDLRVESRKAAGKPDRAACTSARLARPDR